MCGIVGSINFPLDTSSIKKIMLHRGPDEQNEWKERNVHLYHLRLSILDVEGGKQPMNLHNNYIIIFNGEIYNYAELNEKFNLSVKTNSDTETLLHLYHKMGPSFLEYLDGMFALAIYDIKKKEIFLARDRAGKKPLYFYKQNNQIVFASELNCINALIHPEIAESNIAQYLRLGSFYRKQTPFKNVTEVVGGTYLHISTDSLEVSEHRWWDIHEFYKKKNTLKKEDALDLVDSQLNTAVYRRIISSDLEVGSFLSGGIDSGLVTAIASKYNNALKTYTVSFDGAYDEAPLAKLVAEKYGTQHTEIKISFSNLENDIEQILLNYGEPFFDSSAIPSYYVCKAAKDHLTVILNGDGADELFAGYRRYVPFAKKDWFKTSSFFKQTARFIESTLPLSNDKKNFYNHFHRLFSFAGKSGIDTYLSATTDIFEGNLDKLIGISGNLGDLEKSFKRINQSKISGLSKIMNLDFDTILFSDLLVKMDIATMANSLEGRSPFLSKELLETAPGLADNLKIKGTTTKFLLRELAKRYLPNQLIDQPKRGFEIPLKSWVENELKDIILDYLTPKDAYWRNYINSNWMNRVIDFKENISNEKRAKIIWTLFSLELWYQKIIKK